MNTDATRILTDQISVDPCRITHRFAITDLKEIDDEIKKWMKIAYDLDA